MLQIELYAYHAPSFILCADTQAKEMGIFVDVLCCDSFCRDVSAPRKRICVSVWVYSSFLFLDALCADLRQALSSED